MSAQFHFFLEQHNMVSACGSHCRAFHAADSTPNHDDLFCALLWDHLQSSVSPVLLPPRHRIHHADDLAVLKEPGETLVGADAANNFFLSPLLDLFDEKWISKLRTRQRDHIGTILGKDLVRHPEIENPAHDKDLGALAHDLFGALAEGNHETGLGAHGRDRNMKRMIPSSRDAE